MNIYNYHEATKEFLSQTVARKNPMRENDFLMPANSTKHVLPILLANEVAVFNVALDVWEVKPDFRGVEYYDKATGEPIVFNVGDLPDATMAVNVTAAVLAERAERERIGAIKAEGVSRINQNFEAINDIDQIKFYVEFWQSIAPAARQATADFTKVINIYTAAKTAIQAGTLPADIVWPV